MNIHKHKGAHCLYRRDNFSPGSQLIIGQGYGGTCRGRVRATMHLMPAFAYHLSLLACALICHAFLIFICWTAFMTTQKSHTARKWMQPLRLFFFNSSVRMHASLMWWTSIQKQLLEHVTHTPYLVPKVTHQIKMELTSWYAKEDQWRERSGMCLSTAKVSLSVSLSAARNYCFPP